MIDVLLEEQEAIKEAKKPLEPAEEGDGVLQKGANAEPMHEKTSLHSGSHIGFTRQDRLKQGRGQAREIKGQFREAA